MGEVTGADRLSGLCSWTPWEGGGTPVPQIPWPHITMSPPDSVWGHKRHWPRWWPVALVLLLCEIFRRSFVKADAVNRSKFVVTAHRMKTTVTAFLASVFVAVQSITDLQLLTPDQVCAMYGRFDCIQYSVVLVTRQSNKTLLLYACA